MSTADPTGPEGSSGWPGVAGAFVGVALTSLVGRWLVADDAGIVPAMGASAVLFFGLPRGAVSSPWSALAGNVVSAVVGVACARLIPEPTVAAACAVAAALGAMGLLRCVHPPGGAVALLAVVGGPAVRQAGFVYVLMPVAINAAVMLAVATAYARLRPRPG